MKDKILIIGSAGFIGRNCEIYFKQKGYDVFCADIIIEQKENYTILNAEIPDFSILFSNQKFNICINASGAASVPLSFKFPALDFSLNTSNVFYLLDAIRKYNPECKFINLSSAAVYGNPDIIPIKEDSSINPLSPYGFHKYYSENICKEFYCSYNINTLSLRIFSVYGEGLKKQLFWDLYRKICDSNDNNIVLFGTGKESRDFIYIVDLLNVIELVISKAEFNGNVINVASGIETTIKEAVETFVKLLDSSVKILFNNENKIGDPRNWRADISIIESMGFQNDNSLVKGLSNYIKWLKNQ